MTLGKVFLFVLAISIVCWVTGIADPPGTGVYQLATNMSQWENATIVSVIKTGIAQDTGITLGGIAIAGGLIVGSELLIVLGMLPWLLSMGKPLATLFGLLQSSFGPEIAVIFAGSIGIIFIMAVLNWWRRGD